MILLLYQIRCAATRTVDWSTRQSNWTGEAITNTRWNHVQSSMNRFVLINTQLLLNAGSDLICFDPVWWWMVTIIDSDGLLGCLMVIIRKFRIDLKITSSEAVPLSRWTLDVCPSQLSSYSLPFLLLFLLHPFFLILIGNRNEGERILLLSLSLFCHSDLYFHSSLSFLPSFVFLLLLCLLILLIG